MELTKKQKKFIFWFGVGLSILSTALLVLAFIPNWQWFIIVIITWLGPVLAIKIFKSIKIKVGK